MDITLIAELAIFCNLMGLSAFFSSCETAMFSLGRLQLEQMREAGNPRAPLIERLLSQPRHLIVTILIGNEFVNIAASVISAAIVIRLLGSESRWVNLLIMVPILLLFGEITPKTLAIRNNVAFATAQCRYIDLFARAISPLRLTVRRVSGFFITMIVGQERSRANILTEDMVRSLTQEAVGDGALDREEAVYINRIFDFGDKAVRDVMTPQSQILYLPGSATLDEAARHYQRTSHTKVPVYETSNQSVAGVLYARDLLEEDSGRESLSKKPITVSAIMRKAYFVPETKPVADLFYTFSKRKLSLALTVDEYGGVTGLVTMEDLMECIFGEIISHSEMLRQDVVNVEKLGDDAYRFDGAITIERFNRLVGSAFDSDLVETVGGLLLQAFGEVPPVGGRIVIEGCVFEVESVAGHRIAHVTVKPALPPEAPSGDPTGGPGPSPGEV